MKRLLITRLSTGLEHGTFGVMAWAEANQPLCLTLEDAWLDNQSFISCIPAGEYVCKRFYSNRFKMDTFQVMDVRGRTYILIHKGNLDDDTEGCILVGERFGSLPRGKAILGSSKAWERLWSQIKDLDEFLLSISWANAHAPIAA